MYIKQWRFGVNLNHCAVFKVYRYAKSPAINRHRFHIQIPLIINPYYCNHRSGTNNHRIASITTPKTITNITTSVASVDSKIAISIILSLCSFSIDSIVLFVFLIFQFINHLLKGLCIGQKPPFVALLHFQHILRVALFHFPHIPQDFPCQVTYQRLRLLLLFLRLGKF